MAPALRRFPVMLSNEPVPRMEALARTCVGVHFVCASLVTTCVERAVTPVHRGTIELQAPQTALVPRLMGRGLAATWCAPRARHHPSRITDH